MINTAAKAKRALLTLEIDRDELAFRIAQKCIGLKAPAGTDPTSTLAEMDAVTGADGSMADGFRRAADAALDYFHERVNAGASVQ